MHWKRAYVVKRKRRKTFKLPIKVLRRSVSTADVKLEVKEEKEKC